MRIKVQGDLAMFSRGETRSEPYSYDVPPRTAIKGILESIFWKPEMGYSINSLVVCNEIKLIILIVAVSLSLNRIWLYFGSLY